MIDEKLKNDISSIAVNSQELLDRCIDSLSEIDRANARAITDIDNRCNDFYNKMNNKLSFKNLIDSNYVVRNYKITATSVKYKVEKISNKMRFTFLEDCDLTSDLGYAVRLYFKDIKNLDRSKALTFSCFFDKIDDYSYISSQVTKFNETNQEVFSAITAVYDNNRKIATIDNSTDLASIVFYTHFKPRLYKLGEYFEAYFPQLEYGSQASVYEIIPDVLQKVLDTKYEEIINVTSTQKSVFINTNIDGEYNIKITNNYNQEGANVTANYTVLKVDGGFELTSNSASIGRCSIYINKII